MFWVDKKLLKPRIGECSEAEDTAPVVGYADAVFGKEDVLHPPAGGRLVVGTREPRHRLSTRAQEQAGQLLGVTGLRVTERDLHVDHDRMVSPSIARPARRSVTEPRTCVIRGADCGKIRDVAELWLLVGLPAAGKTTVAKQIADEQVALRLSPDEWMIPLFGESEAAGKRDVLEGRLITIAFQVLRLGTSVVLDFGCWARDERAALHWLATVAGAGWQLVYLPIDRATQLEHVALRWQQSPNETFSMSDVTLDAYRVQFDIPGAGELAGAYPERPPAGWPDWIAWAANRWPSLTIS